MSTFEPVTATCASCGAEHEVDRVVGVNVDRMPRHRAAVLDGTFQETTCPACGAKARIPPGATYIDLGRGHWIRVETAADIGERDAHEARARALFDKAYGAGAPPLVQAMGAQLRPRLVYGWPALREKLVCDDLGLDDTVVELLKAAVLREVPGAPMGAPESLRLVSGDDAQLVFLVTNDESEETGDALEIPRDVYDDIRGDEAAWAPLREDLDASYLVDVTRFTR